MDKAPEAFRTISEVAAELEIPQHVLRFWESRFHEIRPMKRGGGRRYYRPQDMDLLRGIRHLLYAEGYTIRGVQRILKEQGQRFVQNVWQPGAPQPPRTGADTALREAAAEVAPREELGNASPDESEAERASPRGLSERHVRSLQAVLDDLRECRRLLDTALQKQS
ncbi:MAG TPA: MerR family transcriptional regulator [Xanthobacteraceae bacterium]